MAESILKILPRGLIEKALKGETAESRALATQGVGRRLRDIDLSESERAFCKRLFDHISQDVCDEVRRALSITLRCSRNLPRDIANRLMADIDSVAIPILSDSPVVTDDDLIVVLRSRASAKLRAVAGRSSLSERVSGAVISFGDSAAVAKLAANDGALISARDAGRIATLAIDDDLIREAALRRQDFPMEIVTRLVGEHVKHMKDSLPAPHADQIATATGERVLSRYAAPDWPADTLAAYVDAMAKAGLLDPNVIARAAGQGDWRFLQLALAKRAGISAAKAGMIAFDHSVFGLRALGRRAGLDEAAIALLCVSAAAFRDLERSAVPITREDFQSLMIERIATHPEMANPETEARILDWLDDGLGLRAVA